MKYFRNYPLGLQWLLFLLMVFVFYSLGSLCILLLPPAFGTNVNALLAIDEHSPRNLLVVSLLLQGLFSLILFAVTALVYGYLSHPDVKKYLGLKKPRAIQVIFAILLMLGAMPVLSVIADMIKHSGISFPESVLKEQETNDRLMNAYMVMPGFADFLRTFTVMAIIPAIGEELFFRGLFMRMTVKIGKSISLGIVFTAVIFAYTHTNIFGLVSISIAGALLAWVYYITGSLWPGIFAHMLFNGSQIILAYIGHSNAAVEKFNDANSTPWVLVAAGAAVAIAAGYLLWKSRTPLPPNWTDDFEPGELAAAKGDQTENN